MPDADAGQTFDHSTETCREMLRRAFPDLAILSVETLGEGWDSVAYLINRSLVFRLPKRPDVDLMLRRERALLGMIADLLPAPVPRFSHIAEPVPGCSFSVAGYPLIHGTPLTMTETRRVADYVLASDLARFLKALHAIDSSRLPPHALERSAPEDWWTERLDLFKFAIFRIEAGLPPAAAGVFARDWQESFDASRRIGFTPRLVHNDLDMEHLLVNSYGRLAGVIDFGDARLGDPAIDVAGLPDALARTVIFRYEADPIERTKLAIRRRFYRLTVPLQAIRAGVDLDRDDLLQVGLMSIRQYLDNRTNPARNER